MTGRAKNFKCPTCRESFHIKRLNSHWVRFMPPKYCPMCGCEVERKKVGE